MVSSDPTEEWEDKSLHHELKQQLGPCVSCPCILNALYYRAVSLCHRHRHPHCHRNRLVSVVEIKGTL